MSVHMDVYKSVKVNGNERKTGFNLTMLRKAQKVYINALNVLQKLLVNTF